ncbi:hypothetical protein [Vibrio viridaestus]|uniref:Uncharacterized protein n=1 Tax=Vibrio viridaestus TaxID=2487322 RepID=A0A3N9THT6_9VIBR|nr:hypothetical protein [Vibrio viridaestus]RQW63443.1 hypothetical protein EES38_09355 [Vibrio viridaestus]
MKRKYNVRVKGDELIIIVIKDTPYIVVDGLISSFGLSYNQSIVDLKSNHDLKSIEISNDGNVQKKFSYP